MNKPILTIGIPTYNHAQSLRECLAIITAQFEDAHVRDRVEVFISDNNDKGSSGNIVDEYHSDDGCEDNTQEIVELYQKRFSNIRYSRNGKNIGFDRNVDAVLSNAKGDFCWILSSNEYIEPGSIQYVLAMLEKHRDTAFFCVSNLRGDKNKKEVKVFKNGDQWLREMGLFGGQISQCIFNLKYLPDDRAKYYDNVWFHLALFWEIVSRRQIILLPCLFRLSAVDASCRWAQGGWAFRTYIYLKRIVIDLPKYGYDQRTIDTVVRGLAKGLPRTVASAKRYGLPITWDRFSLMVREFHRYPVYLFISIGVFLTPAVLLRAVKKMK